MKARIKKAAWEKYLWDQGKDMATPNPGPKDVVETPDNPPFDGAVMLCYPSYWWDKSDVDFLESD